METYVSILLPVLYVREPVKVEKIFRTVDLGSHIYVRISLQTVANPSKADLTFR
jgi:hypothetical protein